MNILRTVLFFCVLGKLDSQIIHAETIALQELSALTQAYEAKKTVLVRPLTELAGKYRGALERLRDDSMKAGKLENVLGANEAMKSLNEVATGGPSKNAEVERLRKVYVQQRELIAKPIIKEVLKAANAYLDQLKTMKETLTRKGMIEDASAVAMQETVIRVGLKDLSSTSPALIPVQVGGKPQQRSGWVVAWGHNDEGNCSVPKDLGQVIAVAAGSKHSMALKVDGTVAVWGSNANHQLEIPEGLSNVKAIAAGGSYCLAVKQDGTVVAWGLNSKHECDVPPGLSNVSAISSKGETSMALKEDGTVVTWGSGCPGKNDPPAGLNEVTSISAGQLHLLALKADGSIVSWGGANEEGQTTVPEFGRAIAVSGGRAHSLALKGDGTVVAWGSNKQAQCKIPEGLSHVTAIGSGLVSNVALKADGKVSAWGETLVVKIPKKMPEVFSIAVGYFHVLAIASQKP